MADCSDVKKVVQLAAEKVVNLVHLWADKKAVQLVETLAGRMVGKMVDWKVE